MPRAGATTTGCSMPCAHGTRAKRPRPRATRAALARVCQSESSETSSGPSAPPSPARGSLSRSRSGLHDETSEVTLSTVAGTATANSAEHAAMASSRPAEGTKREDVTRRWYADDPARRFSRPASRSCSRRRCCRSPPPRRPRARCSRRGCRAPDRPAYRPSPSRGPHPGSSAMPPRSAGCPSDP